MSLIIPKNFKRAKAQDASAQDAKFKVGDRVKHAKVKSPVQPIGKISEVYNDQRWVEVEWENMPYKYQTIETSNLLPANSRAADADEFKVGDKVRRGMQTGIVRGIEKAPYIEVKFTDEPVTVFVRESEIVAADSRAADACGTDVKLQKGDKVRVWQYPVYGKMGEVVEATNGSIEYTVNVEGKDYPRIDYRRIVKVSNTAGDAADKGRWITTENGNHVHIDKSGNPDKGNPHVVKAMKKGGKSAVGKKSDKATKTDKPNAGKAKIVNKAETAKNMSLSPQEYWEKYNEPKPMGVYGDKIHFHDGNFSFRSREISLPEKGQNFGNAPDNVKSDMRAIVKGLAKNGNDPKWKEVAEKFLPAAKEFYKDADVPFTKQDLSWIEEKLGKMG